MRSIFKTKILINQSKANVDEKSLFGKITHLYDPTIRKMTKRGLHRNRELHVPHRFTIYVALKFTSSVLEMEFKFQ